MVSTALFQSGVLTRNSLLQAQISNGGDTVNLPFWLGMPPRQLGGLIYLMKPKHHLYDQPSTNTKVDVIVSNVQPVMIVKDSGDDERHFDYRRPERSTAQWGDPLWNH